MQKEERKDITACRLCQAVWRTKVREVQYQEYRTRVQLLQETNWATKSVGKEERLSLVFAMSFFTWEEEGDILVGIWKCSCLCVMLRWEKEGKPSTSKWYLQTLCFIWNAFVAASHSSNNCSNIAVPRDRSQTPSLTPGQYLSKPTTEVFVPPCVYCWFICHSKEMERT